VQDDRQREDIEFPLWKFDVSLSSRTLFVESYDQRIIFFTNNIYLKKKHEKRNDGNKKKFQRIVTCVKKHRNDIMLRFLFHSQDPILTPTPFFFILVDIFS